MVLERIRKAHEMLFELEDIRYTLVTIGTVYNPLLTEDYEAELMGKLSEAETLLAKIKECLHRKVATAALSSDVLTGV